MRSFTRIVAVLGFISIPAVAQPLSITTPPSLPPATVNQAYSTQLNAAGGSTPYTWHFELGTAPAHFTLSAAGLLTGTPTSADLGTQTFYIQVTDANSTTVTMQFSVLVQSTQPLALTTAAFPPGVVGIAYSLPLAASGGVPPYKWNVLPAIVTFPVPGQVAPGLQLDSGSGVVSGSPASAGMFSFTITLTDSANGSVSKPYSLTVSAGGPLTITTSSLPGGIVGASYSQTLQATGGVPPYKWSVGAGALPAGLTLDASAGTIAGAPLGAGAGNFTIALSDSAATPGTVRQPLSITVVSPPPLVLTTTSLPGGTQGAPYSQQLAASGGVPPYTWSVSSGALPAGLALSAQQGTLSGMPTAAGTSTFTVQVTDSSAATKAKASQAFSVSISQLTQLSVNGGTLAAGTVNAPYSQNLTASGGAAPYSWSVIAGSLPPGLLLSGAGTVSGVPTVAASFGFTAQAVDASGASAIGTFTLPLNAAPLSLPAPVFPSGVAGVPYPSQLLTAAGGTPPYTFSIQGSLPGGLSLSNGLIAGTPGSNVTATFTVKVTDSAQMTATAAAQITIRSSLPADLVLSAGALSFSLASGASGLPEPQALVVASSGTSALSYQLAVSPAAPWLTISGGLTGTFSTPGGLSLSLSAQALALTPSATPYATTVTVMCVAPSPCAGSSQKVPVSLTVASPAPQLTLTKSLLALQIATPNGQALGQFGIQNAGGDVITVSSVTSPDAWVNIGSVPSTVTAGPASYVAVTANPNGLPAGLYRSTITIATSAGSANLPVTLLFSTVPITALNPAGQQFQMTAGGTPGDPAGSLQVLAAGTATLNWSAATLPGAAWLKVKTATGSSTPSAPGVLSYAVDTSASAALAAGTYYGVIRVTSAQITNTPQDFLVVLNVNPIGTLADPDPEPGGLLFLSTGSASLPAQSVSVYASSTTPVPYTATAQTASGTPWLTVTPTSGFASAAAPGSPSISVNPAGLTPGVYRGVVTYQFSPASLRSVNVTYIVPALLGGLPFDRRTSSDAASPHASGTCTPVKLVAAATGIPSNFAPQLAWPVPLSFQLTDDCGNNVPNGAMDVTFTSGDSALSLSPDPSNPGRYAGTWTPRAAVAQVTITASASAAGLTPATVQVTGKVTPNAAPVLTPGAMLNVFNPQVGGGIAPGTAVAIYGSNFAPAGTSTIASALPFPTTLSNVSVVIGGVPAPLYFVSPGQINAEAPFELVAGSRYQVLVNANGALTMPDSFFSTPGAPGVAAYAYGGVIAQHLDGTLINPSSPAMPGEPIVFYLAGLGSAVNQPATGNPAPAPPTGPLSPVTVTLNGAVTPTLFVGLTPGTVGLYQIDLTVPSDTPDGNQVLTIAQSGAVSNVTLLPVHH